jgi:hypothetical protein
MKTQPIVGNKALTLVEVLAVIVVVAAAMAILLPPLLAPPHQHLNCVNNLKQIYLAARIWSEDNDDQYPMQVAATNDAMMKWVGSGRAYVMFLMMSNELSSPKILACSEDRHAVAATNFADLSDRNISYFLSLDASLNEPQTIVAGDDNFLVNGKPVAVGILNSSTNMLRWTKERMRGDHAPGNIGFSDGSVQQTTITSFQQALKQNGGVTNRWVIP